MRAKLRTFKFLLWYRELQEEQAKARLHQAGVHLRKLIEERRILEEELNSCYEHIAERRVFTGEELRLWGNYFETLREFQEISANKISAQRKIIEDLVEDLRAKHQAKEVVELLYGRVKKNYEQMLRKRDLQELDDLYLMTWRR